MNRDVAARRLITRSGVFCTPLHSSSDRVEDGTEEGRGRREEGDARVAVVYVANAGVHVRVLLSFQQPTFQQITIVCLKRVVDCTVCLFQVKIRRVGCRNDF